MAETVDLERRKEIAAGLTADPPTPFFKNVRDMAVLFLRLYGTVTITGKENIPATGGFMLVSNHRAHVDPPLLARITPRQVFFMGKEELFHGFVGFFVKRLGVFPVRRGSADRAALRTAMDLIKAGKIVGLFPEGTRSPDRLIGQAEKGYGLIVKQTDCVILPVAIEGTERMLPKGSVFFHRSPITITIGKPFRASEILARFPDAGKEALAILGRETMLIIQSLMVDPMPLRDRSNAPDSSGTDATPSSGSALQSK